MKDLKQRTLRGGLAKVCSQGTNFLLRVGSLMILARLLTPKDFGLVGMVTAVIGIFNVFKDFGLSTATVQRQNVTQEESSTLFWINILVGVVLGLVALGLGPFVAKFYHEPRLVGVTAVLASGFVFNAAGVQHSALLQRQMRFTTISMIDIIALFVSTSTGIGMALAGYGYWSLAATTVITPLVYSIGVWIAAKWIPGRPRRHTGIGSILRFGGTLTANGIVMYIASNLEKVLLGRFWGVDAIGIYGRAYQLINIPTDNLNSSAGEVAFAALSRVQQQPSKLRSYFLKGYSLVVSLTLPITIACALFADSMILVFLGAKWKEAAPVFRLLAPTTLVFATVNPLGWLLSSLGLVKRGLKIALVLAPVMITGYALGLPYGPKGVALGYSSVMLICVLPLVAWAVHGTPVHFNDIIQTASRPLISGIVAATVTFAVQRLYEPLLSPLPRLVIGVTMLMSIYTVMLLYVMGQARFYLDLIRNFTSRSPAEETVVPI